MNFFYCSTRALTLVSAITLLAQVPLQKFPFLFIIIIPCFNIFHIWSCPFPALNKCIACQWVPPSHNNNINVYVTVYCSLSNDPFYSENIEAFKEAIDITHRATNGNGFIAVKPTALCSPNLWVC